MLLSCATSLENLQRTVSQNTLIKNSGKHFDKKFFLILSGLVIYLLWKESCKSFSRQSAERQIAKIYKKSITLQTKCRQHLKSIVFCSSEREKSLHITFLLNFFATAITVLNATTAQRRLSISRTQGSYSKTYPLLLKNCKQSISDPVEQNWTANTVAIHGGRSHFSASHISV